jgi:purine-binding chemotaxis protein CheW
VRALILPVGEELYAIPMTSVRQVLEHPSPTRLPTAPAPLLGLLNVQGDLVPLFDTGALMASGPVGAPLFAAVVEVAEGRGALATTAMPVAVELGDPLGPADTAGATGIFAWGDRLAVLLDLEAILTRPRTDTWPR